MSIYEKPRRSGGGVNKQFLIFCAFGAVNTLVHGSAVIIQVDSLGFNQVPANIVAFFIANILSYAMNSRFTFDQRLSLGRYLKFLGSSLATLVITLVISTAGEMLSLHYLVTTATLIVVAPVITFTLLKKFAFRT
jgi:putative flippase GtrA